MIENNPAMEQRERLRVFRVNEIDPLGYGNESATISYRKKIESGEYAPEVIEKAVEIIKSGECMVDVTEPDDGCFDGRTAVEVMFVNAVGELETQPVTDDDSHERPEVAGGGYITGEAMYLGFAQAGKNLDDDLRQVTTRLGEQHCYCGAHTGSHGQGEATDCGANDKFIPILGKGIQLQGEIGGTTEALVNLTGKRFDGGAYSQAISNWELVAGNPEYVEGSTGTSRLGVITDSIREAQQEAGDVEKPFGVTKHLAFDHNEGFLLANFVEGKTFSQAAFREKLMEAFPELPPEKLPQIFPPDMWRVAELADKLGKDDKEKAIALHAGIAFQLATAALLTDGTLRTFIVNQ